VNTCSARKSLALVLAPVVLAALLTGLDRDFQYTVPIAAGSGFLVALVSFMGDSNGRWGLHGLIAGAAGFAGMLALMNVQI
jgi:hypothetical protein